MGFLLWQGGQSAVRASDLKTTSRFVLRELADSAQDGTGLTWRSQADIADVVDCNPKYMPKVMADLRDAGMVSTWHPDHRKGRVPLTFVHPGGISARQMVDIKGKKLPPITIKAVRAHLRTGPFSATDIADVITWLRGLGALALTPQLSGGDADRPPNAFGVHPPTEWGITPQLSGAEPKENPNKTERAGTRPAILDGLAGPPAEKDASATRNWATPEILASLKAAPEKGA